MIDPLIAVGVNICLAAKRTFIEHAFGALVNNGALIARKRYPLGIGLNEVLTNLRANGLK